MTSSAGDQLVDDDGHRLRARYRQAASARSDGVFVHRRSTPPPSSIPERNQSPAGMGLTSLNRRGSIVLGAQELTLIEAPSSF